MCAHKSFDNVILIFLISKSYMVQTCLRFRCVDITFVLVISSYIGGHKVEFDKRLIEIGYDN